MTIAENPGWKTQTNFEGMHVFHISSIDIAYYKYNEKQYIVYKNLLNIYLCFCTPGLADAMLVRRISVLERMFLNVCVTRTY